MYIRSSINVFFNAALLVCCGLIFFLLSELMVISIRFTYVAFTVLLLIYLLLEVLRIRRNEMGLWLLNPAVLCALMTFVMGYGLTNILYFLPQDKIAFLGLVPEVTPAMVKIQYLVLFGAISMFLGYWSPLAANFTKPQLVIRFQNRFLPKTDVLRGFAIPILLLIAVTVRLFAISKGLYGYGGDYSAERLAVTGDYSQYLNLASGLGKLALLLSALRYFNSESGLQDTRWFLTSLLIEIFFGILSGAKSGVIMPFVISGLCAYLVSGKIPNKFILMTVASIVMAYAVIEPFRELRNQQDGALVSASATLNIIMQGAFSDNRQVDLHEEGSTLLAFIARNNLSYIGSHGVIYADMFAELPAGSPAFLDDILLAPLHALIPRFIWDSKPIANLGLWYTQVPIGKNLSSSTAMGPFVYLYFTGGYVAVGIAFFIIGMLQRCLLLLTTPWKREAGAVFFFVLLPSLININSAVNSIIIDLVRTPILITIVLHLLYRMRF